MIVADVRQESGGPRQEQNALRDVAEYGKREARSNKHGGTRLGEHQAARSKNP